MEQNIAAFMYKRNTFPRKSDTKIKGVFVGPQIGELIQDVKFEDQLREVEKSAWIRLKNITTNLLGNHKAENCHTVSDLVQSYNAVRFNMSLNVHFIDSHIHFVPEYLGAVSNEHGERFHQNISTMETRDQGKWNPSVLAVDCWALRRDVSQAKCSRKSSTVAFFK